MESKVRVTSVEDARIVETFQTRGNTLRVTAKADVVWNGVIEISFLCHAAQHPQIDDELVIDIAGLPVLQAKAG